MFLVFWWIMFWVEKERKKENKIEKIWEKGIGEISVLMFGKLIDNFIFYWKLNNCFNYLNS